MRIHASLVFGLCLLGCSPPPPTTETTLSDWLGGGDTAGFERALTPRVFAFPRDHGPHPGFRNEWWYVTGNLDSNDGRRFGFQVTFFRIALVPEPIRRPSDWGASEVWMAHVALSDPLSQRHLDDERLVRGAAGLAGARSEPLRVWVEDWQLTGNPGFPWQLDVQAGEFTLALNLRPATGVTLQGDEGLSRKSREPGNASYYYSITRLATSGRVALKGQSFEVAGLSWLDREWSTSALGDEQVGWDWFALQFDDGRDLMYYQLRRKQGGKDPMSAGSLRLANGDLIRLDAGVGLTPLRWWQAANGKRYPVSWRLTLPDSGVSYRVDAVFDNQLMDTQVSYWEGMVNVYTEGTALPVGRGYLELAGY